jgi:hypothetical protein
MYEEQEGDVKDKCGTMCVIDLLLLHTIHCVLHKYSPTAETWAIR